AARRLDQPPRHVRIERVAPVRTVHGDGEQAVVEVLQDDFVGHEWVPLFVVIGLSFVASHSSLRAQRSNPLPTAGKMDCFVARAPRNDGWVNSSYFFTSGQRDSSSDWNASLPGIVASSL